MSNGNSFSDGHSFSPGKAAMEPAFFRWMSADTRYRK
jgi:hypothetical protein